MTSMLGATSTIMPALSVEGSSQHCEGIVAIFAALRDAGHDYLSRSRLTALYLAWAAFPALIQPLPEDFVPDETAVARSVHVDAFPDIGEFRRRFACISRADLSQLADTTR
jgi:hypothetical protein